MHRLLWAAHLGTLIVCSSMLCSVAATADVGGAFGVPPSGKIEILFNDHHVYTKPDVLKEARVLAALVRGGTLLIPLRSMFEQMGATVSYDAASKTVTISKPGAEVKVTVGKPEVVINGESLPLDVPPMISQGALLVPVRVISQGMGAYVQWVPARHIVVVRYLPATPPPSPAPPPPPPPPPTPTPSPVSPGPVQDSTFQIYNARFPEWGLSSGQAFYGRYSYVLMTLAADNRNDALLTALARGYVPLGHAIKPGIPTLGVSDVHDYNIFEVPVTSSASGDDSKPATDRQATTLLKKYYSWAVASNIRDDYCKTSKHSAIVGICANPRDKGPFIITFFAPIPRLGGRLQPASSYDFSGVSPDADLMGTALDAIQARISTPAGVKADEVLPPSVQIKVATVLDGTNHAIGSAVGGLKVVGDILEEAKNIFGGGSTAAPKPPKERSDR